MACPPNCGSGIIIRETNAAGGNMFNVKVVPRGVPIDPNLTGLSNPVFYIPPPEEQWVPGQFCAVECNRLREENEMLKRELQNCYVYISKQEAQFREVKQFEEVQRKYLERQKRKNYSAQRQRYLRKLETQTLQRQIEMQVTNAKIAEQHEELERMRKVIVESNKKVEAQQKQIKELESIMMEQQKKAEAQQKKAEAQQKQTKELESIMMEQQKALEQLGLQKLVLDGKLKGIREFVKQVNSDFSQGVEDLKKDYGFSFGTAWNNIAGGCQGDDASAQNDNAGDDDEDETELKHLRRNLNALSTLVKDTLEESIQARRNENIAPGSMAVSKIHLRKQSRDQGSSEEDWSIVPSSDQSNSNVDKESGTVVDSQTSTVQRWQSGNQDRGGRSIPFRHRAITDATKPNCCCCGFQAGNRSELRMHLRAHNASLKFQCNLCNRRFVRMAFLKMHYQTRHNIPCEMNKDCGTCGETFPTLGDLHQHQLLAHQSSSIGTDQVEDPIPSLIRHALNIVASSNGQQQQPQQSPLETTSSSSPTLENREDDDLLRHLISGDVGW